MRLTYQLDGKVRVFINKTLSTETTTHTVSLHDIVCVPDANTNVMHVRALSDWMMMLLLTTPSEVNMYTLLESKTCYRSMGTTGDPIPVGQRDVPVNHFTD